VGQDIYGILDYFKGDETSVYDYLIIAFLLLLILALVVFSWRELRLRRIAGNEEAFRRMKKPPKRVVKWRDKKGIGSGKLRRKAPRLEKNFPVNISLPNAYNMLTADIIDISAGGARLLIYDVTPQIKVGVTIDVNSTEPPFDIMGIAAMEIMSMKPYPDNPYHSIIAGRWTELDLLAGKALQREVNHQLEILADEEWEKEQQAKLEAEQETEEESKESEETKETEE